MNSQLVRRVFLVAIKAGEVQGELPGGDESLPTRLFKSVQRASTGQTTRVTQQEVKAAAFSQWLAGTSRLGVSSLRRATGARMPTVISAFRAVRREGLVVPHGSGWQLSADLPWSSMRRLAEAYAAKRRLLGFTDPSGLENGVDALLASRVNLTQASRIANLGLLSSLNINIEAFEAPGRHFRMEVVKQLRELAA